MATTFLKSILSSLQHLWTCLIQISRFGFKRNSTTLLPTSSPATGQNVTTKITSPPRAWHRFLPRSPPTLSSNRAWARDKEDFLRRPTLSPKANIQHPGKRRRMNALLALSQPEILVEDWSSPRIPLPDLQDPSQSTVSISSSLTASPDRILHGSSLRLSSPPTKNSGTVSDDAEDDIIIEPLNGIEASASRATDSKATNNISSRLPEEPERSMRFSFEPIRTTLNTHSAVCGFLWDPPTSVVPAAMVPVPLFTSTPPKNSCLSSSGQARLSLMPYPDLFDFAMYDKRASQASSFGEFSFGLLPYSALDSPVALTSSPSARREQYRHAIYSPPDRFCSPLKIKQNSILPHGCTVPRPRNPVGEITLASISFNTPQRVRAPTPAAIKSRDSPSLYSCQSSSGDWNVISHDDVSDRLREACHDLSRCMWTDEEFLRIVSP